MIDKSETSFVCGKRGNVCFEKELENYQVILKYCYFDIFQMWLIFNMTGFVTGARLF